MRHVNRLKTRFTTQRIRFWHFQHRSSTFSRSHNTLHFFQMYGLLKSTLYSVFHSEWQKQIRNSRMRNCGESYSWYFVVMIASICKLIGWSFSAKASLTYKNENFFWWRRSYTYPSLEKFYDFYGFLQRPISEMR